MDPETIEQAARARAEGVAARADRPTQRRCARDQHARAWVTAPTRGVAVRASEGTGDLLTFEGYATVYERGYEMYDFWGPYTEVISTGAAASSLARADLDVPLVLNHDSLRRIARTTTGSLVLTEDDNGLHVLADELDPADHDVAYIAPKLRARLVDEMSFMFRITKGQWSPDYTEFRIEEFDLHRGDVAIVGYGANPHTNGSGLRSALDIPDLLRSMTPDQRRSLLTELTSERWETPLAPSRSRLVEDEDLLLPLLD